jgi:plasmid stabilization system protein ParE
MRLRYHPLVQRDVTEILTYYEAISPALADGFWDEFEDTIVRIQEAPTHCHFDATGLRRTNMQGFPTMFFLGFDRIRSRSLLFVTTGGGTRTAPEEGKSEQAADGGGERRSAP